MTLDCAFNWAEVRDIAGPCIRPGGPALTARALKICDLSPGSRVVDIGCGAGGTLSHLEGAGPYRTTGLDYSDTLLKQAAPRLPSAGLVRGRAETLPFKEGLFDALFCECVLSVLGDREAALGEYTRVLKGGGYLVVSDVFEKAGPREASPGEASQELGIKRLLSKEALLDALESLGFSLLLWEEHERSLKEFAARLILAGQCLPDLWGRGRARAGRSGISYFLLVAQKSQVPFSQDGNEGGGTP